MTDETGTPGPQEPATTRSRCFAVLPAAGRSRRMGQPKLLMPWRGYETMLDRVLEQWRASAVDQLVVVVRADDHALAARCRRAGISPLLLNDPPEMKDSVLSALRLLESRLAPGPQDAWMLSPADTPGVTAELIDHLLHSRKRQDRVLVPHAAGRRGHPVLVPWRWSIAEVAALTPDQGVNALLERLPTRLVPWHEPRAFDDVDTPDDYHRGQEDSPS